MLNDEQLTFVRHLLVKKIWEGRLFWHSPDNWAAWRPIFDEQVTFASHLLVISHIERSKESVQLKNLAAWPDLVVNSSRCRSKVRSHFKLSLEV